jgi:hypothetical protein
VGSYKLYRNNAFLKQVGSPATTTSDITAAASSVYGYQVSAVDNAGNESQRSTMANTNTPTCVTGGAHVWSRQMGGTVLADAMVPYAITIDASGNVYVTGVLYGTVRFDNKSVTSAGRADMFLAKYSSAGVIQWVKGFGDDADQFGTAIDTDASGNVYVTGYFFGTVGFGGPALTSEGYDIVLAKYDTNGGHVWSRRMGGTGLDTVTGLGADGLGNPTAAGYFAGTASFTRKMSAPPPVFGSGAPPKLTLP